MDVDAEQLDQAVRKRKAYILENLQTTTVKQCRALLEKDLNLAEGALKPHKDLVNTLIDKLMTPESTAAEASPPPLKRPREAGEPGKAPAAKRAKAKPAKPAPAKAKPAPAKAKPAAAKAKPAPAKPAARDGAAPAAYGSRVERLRQLCRAATIPIPPNAYRAAKAGGGEAALETALEALLAKHGLSRSSDRAATDAARARLQLQKDLDGMDVANIVEGGRGGRRGAAARPAVNYAAMTRRGSDSDDSAPSDADSAEARPAPATGDENRATNRQDPKRGGRAAPGARAEAERAGADAEDAAEAAGAEGGSGSDGAASPSDSEFKASGDEEQGEEEGAGASEGAAGGSSSGGSADGASADGAADGAAEAPAAVRLTRERARVQQQGAGAAASPSDAAAARPRSGGLDSASPAARKLAAGRRRALVLSDDED